MVVAIHPAETTRPDDVVAVLETHRQALRSHCRRILGSPTDADDAVQDTLLRAWRGSSRFEGRASMSTWLHRIATNVCIDMLRARHRRPVACGDIADGEAASEVEVLDLVVDRDAAARAVAALALLPARQRSAFVLRDVFGWSAAETAELLDCSVASANSALQRARETIRRQRPATTAA